MILRISIVESSEQPATLRLEGHITGPWVEALEEICECRLRDDEGLILDLGGVSYVDRDGVALLTTLTTRQVAFVNPQPFVRGATQDGGGMKPR